MGDRTITTATAASEDVLALLPRVCRSFHQGMKGGVTSLIVAAFLLFGVVATPVSLGAARRSDTLPEKERLIIEALITGLESLTEAQFIRNGKAYSPASAGKFLRAKWKDRSAQVRSAEDFIAKVATRSSTTGHPYLVRYSDGREIPSEAVLRRDLERLRGTQ